MTTIFLASITDDVKLEVVLYRSYNRFMAEVWKKGQGRFRWVTDGVAPVTKPSVAP
jgi:hypothetical protein